MGVLLQLRDISLYPAGVLHHPLSSEFRKNGSLIASFSKSHHKHNTDPYKKSFIIFLKSFTDTACPVVFSTSETGVFCVGNGFLHKFGGAKALLTFYGPNVNIDKRLYNLNNSFLSLCFL